MDQVVHMAAVEIGSFNMAKLARVGELVEAVVEGGISLDDAYNLLDEIEALPNPWGPFAKAVSFMFIGVGFSGLMSGNIVDIFISGILALLVYVNVYIAHNHGGTVAGTTAFFQCVCHWYSCGDHKNIYAGNQCFRHRAFRYYQYYPRFYCQCGNS